MLQSEVRCDCKTARWLAHCTCVSDYTNLNTAFAGKTAVNCGGVKNSVGSFCAPTACLIDTAFFCSLPLRHRAAGMAEIIKIGDS